MILRPGQARVADRAADHEAAGRVDEEVLAQLGGVVEVLREDRLDHVLPQVLGDQLLGSLAVLRGDQELFDLDRPAVHVADGDLGLAVGAQVVQRAGLSNRGEALGQAVREGDRQRHQRVRLVARRSRTSSPGRPRRRRRARLRRSRRSAPRTPCRRPGRCPATACRSRSAPRRSRPRSRGRRRCSRSCAPSRAPLSWMSTYVSVEISPETTIRPVLTSVSQATLPYGSSASTASSTPSEIWSAILSGWPSVTDSEVNRYSVSEYSVMAGSDQLQCSGRAGGKWRRRASRGAEVYAARARPRGPPAPFRLRSTKSMISGIPSSE